MSDFSTAIRVTCPNAKMASILAHLLHLEGAPAAWLFGLEDGRPYVQTQATHALVASCIDATRLMVQS